MPKYLTSLCISLMVLLFAICTTIVRAQPQATTPSQTPQSENVADSMAFARMMQSDLELFMELEIELMGNAVKEAPFSAQLSLETEQFLQDGTRVARKTEGSLYRDSAGRVRQEITLSLPLPAAAPPNTGSMIMIFDPSSGTQWTLEPASKLAMKVSMPTMSLGKSNADSNLDKNLTLFGGAESEGSAENLGEQNVEGVTANGTRRTHDIPAGQMGNDQPLKVIMERWYSPEIHMSVLIKRSDPLTGSKTLKVTGIRQQEPDAALFSVPADYQVKDMSMPGDMEPKKPVQP